MRSFDREARNHILTKLSPLGRAAVAASCAERLIPSFERYWGRNHGRRSVFREALDEIWSYLSTRNFHATPRIKVLREQIEDYIPDEDELQDDPYAQEAAIAVVDALDVLLQDDVASCLECLEQAYNVADSVALRQIVPDGVISESAETGILEHAVVQSELERQERDITFCLEHDLSEEGLAILRGWSNAPGANPASQAY